VGLKDLFKKPPQDEVVGAKVLVAALDSKFAELLNADSQIYSQLYRATAVMELQTIDQLFATVETGYDIVHLLCDVSDDGQITDGRGNKIIGTALLQKCCDSNVKLLWLASDIKGASFTAGFKPAGKRLNLIFTVERKGPKFATFLKKLLSGMAAGKTIPVSWVSIISLNPKDPRQKDGPDIALIAGRGGVLLR
jgi:hypothetical protein